MIEFVLSAVLFSVVVFFAAYVRYLIGKYREISDDLYTVKELVSSYSVGLQSVYESEMFYGEPVIEKLVENTKDLDRELSNILEAYSFEDEPGTNYELEQEQ